MDALEDERRSDRPGRDRLLHRQVLGIEPTHEPDLHQPPAEGGLGVEDRRTVVPVVASGFSQKTGLPALIAATGEWGQLALNAVGALAVTFTLAVNLARGEPIASLAAALAVAAVLYRMWIKAGRPRGVRNAAAEAEAADEPAPGDAVTRA